jgi:hypothetical protein
MLSDANFGKGANYFDLRREARQSGSPATRIEGCRRLLCSNRFSLRDWIHGRVNQSVGRRDYGIGCSQNLSDRRSR